MYERLFKRFFDLILSLAGFVLLSPLLLVLSILGAAAMRGNPFFTQPRPGRIKKSCGKEKIFRLIKFRSMSNAKDSSGKLLPDAQRLNSYGRFLRSSSLDELPSLLNIIKGDMAIVGPRPQLVRDMVFMSPEQRKRHSVRPGLTGLAQVSGRNNISWEQKMDYDLSYIKNISLKADLRIIFKTAAKVLKREDVVREGTVSDIDFGDYLLAKGAVSAEEYSRKQAEAAELLKKS